MRRRWPQLTTSHGGAAVISYSYNTLAGFPLAQNWNSSTTAKRAVGRAYFGDDLDGGRLYSKEIRGTRIFQECFHFASCLAFLLAPASPQIRRVSARRATSAPTSASTPPPAAARRPASACRRLRRHGHAASYSLRRSGCCAIILQPLGFAVGRIRFQRGRRLSLITLLVIAPILQRWLLLLRQRRQRPR